MKKINSSSHLLILYFIIRFFSYFFSPDTPLYGANPINDFVSALILFLTIYLLIKKDVRGWYIIALEIILGGSGGYFAIAGISLRTLLLTFSLLIYFGLALQQRKVSSLFSGPKTVYYLLFTVFLIAIISAARGFLADHDRRLIFSDTIPYLFLFYYFPLKDILKNSEFKQLAKNAIIATIIGGLVVVLGTFIAYSSGLFVLQDNYYHWYRDIALGKVTAVGFNFFRLVLNEQLLLVPLLVWLAHEVINKNHVKKFALFGAALLLILSINLTRIYILALGFSFLFLLSKVNWKRWFVTSALALIIFVGSFTSIYLLASRGQSLGWELFGLRLQSVVDPGIEPSALTRKLLLPKIAGKIKAAPILGAGLGDTITVYSPVFKKEITTSHFDWGYLEILAEMGVAGLVVWILLITYIFIELKKNRATRWHFAALIALCIINVTSPAWFHVMGILLLIYLLASTRAHASLTQSV